MYPRQLIGSTLCFALGLFLGCGWRAQALLGLQFLAMTVHCNSQNSILTIEKMGVIIIIINIIIQDATRRTAAPAQSQPRAEFSHTLGARLVGLCPYAALSLSGSVRTRFCPSWALSLLGFVFAGLCPYSAYSLLGSVRTRLVLVGLCPYSALTFEDTSFSRVLATSEHDNRKHA